MTRPDRPTARLSRRRLIGIAAGGATLLAGCASGTGPGSTDGTADGGATGTASDQTGQFRLLISDQPSAIGDFDSLVVTLDTARVFRAGAEDDEGESDDEGEPDDEDAEESDGEEDEESAPTETTTAGTATATATTTAPNGTTTATPNGTATTTEDTEDDSEDDEDEGDDEAEADDGESDGDGGFSTLDLGGATVDLTEVVGEKATPVFDGQLPAGRYTKVELHVSAVDGVVEGDAVDVKLPSEKLQITKNFEVDPEEPLSFVFDITVVEKGNGGYNLLPVISESGVAGRDVGVEEVGPDGSSTTASGGGNATAMTDGGPPDDAGGPPEDNPGGN